MGVRFASELVETVEAGLRAEADRRVAAEPHLAEIERDIGELEVVDAEATWMLSALRDFANVWSLMTLEKRGRQLYALVATKRVMHNARDGGDRRRRNREL
ncbi:hypothetical protein WMF27_05975 [Sorangium sp. So ce281]|uniref:hypothetical protein n=1 Tax=unclassified Sorangium TaxID=2621164 RepID=UPI003F5D5A96